MLAVQLTFIATKHCAFIEFRLEGSHERTVIDLKWQRRLTKIMVYIRGADVTMTPPDFFKMCRHVKT